jgi:L-seryl-tRNA(Ser) seleniumtransferase
VATALQETVLEYLRHQQGTDPRGTPLPLLEMLALRPEDLRPRAEALVAALAGCAVDAAAGTGTSRCGGGTMPKSELPSVTVDLRPRGQSLAAFSKRLRTGTPPVQSYTAEDAVKLDLRTVFPSQDAALAAAVRTAAGA